MAIQNDNRSAIWGGGTIGLFIGCIIWLITGEPTKILYAVIIGIVFGILAEILAKIGNKFK